MAIYPQLWGMTDSFGFDPGMLPKIELHVHLDTSLSYASVAALIPGIGEEEYRERFVAPPHCRDLHDFLRYTEPCIALLQSEEALYLALRQLLRELLADGVIYAEIRFAPLLHTRECLAPEAVADAACRALQDGTMETGVEARLIFCTLRHFSTEQGLATARLALAFRERGVVGLDLAGDEAAFPIETHIPVYEQAAGAGLPTTAHAGEALGTESFLDTLCLLSPRRIGHGVRSIEDPELLKHLSREGVHLEVCPGSNIQTGIYPNLAAHPLDRLLRAGIPLSINTDGRGLTGTTLSQEYRQIQATFGWKRTDFHRINRMALQAAFCDKRTRERLLARLTASYAA
jgi:adenosine deaminase